MRPFPIQKPSVSWSSTMSPGERSASDGGGKDRYVLLWLCFSLFLLASDYAGEGYWEL